MPAFYKMQQKVKCGPAPSFRNDTKTYIATSNVGADNFQAITLNNYIE